MCCWLVEKGNFKFDMSDVQKTRNYRAPAYSSFRIWTGKPGAREGIGKLVTRNRTGSPGSRDITSKPRTWNGISILRVVESRIPQVASRPIAVSCQFKSKPVTRCCKCSGETDIDAQQNISTAGHQFKRSAKPNSPQYYRMRNMFQGIPDRNCQRLAYAGETSQMSCLLQGLHELKRSRRS